MPGRWSSVEASGPSGTSLSGNRRHSSSSPVGQASGVKRSSASRRDSRSHLGSPTLRLCCSTIWWSSSSGTDTSSAGLVNGALHLQGDETGQLDRVVHRQRLHDRL